MDDAYEARTERMQSILKEELEKEAYKNEAYEMIKKEYGIMPFFDMKQKTRKRRFMLWHF